MKKIILIILISTFVMSTFVAFSQTTTTKKHAPFVSAGIGMTPSQDLSYCAEIGTWGTTSPTSFSITFDAVKNIDTSSDFGYYLGIKPYFTVGEKEKLVYMVYFAPKVQLNADNAYLIEVGFNPYYVIGKNTLFGVTVGNQSLKNSPLNPFVGAGLVYLFRK